MGVAGFVLAFGLDAEEAGGVVEDGFFGIFSVLLPGCVAEFVEVRGFTADSDIFSDEVSLLEGDGEDGTVLVFDLQFLAVFFLGDAFEFPDAVFVMDYEIAFFDIVQGGAGTNGAGFLDGGAAGGAGGAVAAEELGRGENGEADSGEGKGAHELAKDGSEAEIALKLATGELGEAVLLAAVGEDDGYIPVFAFPFVELFEKGFAA